MKRLCAVLLAFCFSGCAELDEFVFDDPYCLPMMTYQPPPPPTQSPRVAPAGYSTGTTQEPELLNSHK